MHKKNQNPFYILITIQTLCNNFLRHGSCLKKNTLFDLNLILELHTNDTNLIRIGTTENGNIDDQRQISLQSIM
jgi:hypothetical protein